MTFPPQQPPPMPGPPPGHQQTPPSPSPQYQPQGPGGAYGPVGTPAGQPVPGQTPTPMMTMGKPGTVTGIQVILWIFLALGAVGDVVSIINMIDFFDPLMLIVLGYALYTTVQSVMTPIHIARGKRWAWIWNLVSVIIGLVFAAVGIVFGIVSIDLTVVPLLVGLVLAGLYGTLLGLLCSKSARQWILMHRIQRGEVQVSGMPGAPGMAPGTGAAPRPERPATRPGAATFAVIAVWLFAALCVWGVWVNVSTAMSVADTSDFISLPGAFLDHENLWMRGIPVVTYTVLLVCAVICAPALTKGAAGGRIFGIVWSIGAILLAGMLFVFGVLEYLEYRDFIPPWESSPYPVMFARHVALQILSILICVFMFVPGVRRWTPRKPATAIVMMAPGAPMGMQAPPPQQQQGYPPRPY